MDFAVIFDMDGVIFDSERAYIDVFRSLCARDGIECDEDICLAVIGSNLDSTRQMFLDRYGEDFAFEKYYDECREVLSRIGFALKPGVHEIFKFLSKNHIPIALASSTSRESVTRMLTNAGLYEYFDAVICGDMVRYSKPHPEIFLTAAAAIGHSPDTCYVIEDSFNGIRAAHAAGMHPLMVPDILQPDEEIRALSEAVLPSLFETRAYLEERL